MIPLSGHLDLGLDKARMKDPRDAERQTRTASILLERLFHDDPARRWELQILADEVGMGKTFVALAVVYSLLRAQLEGPVPGLEDCYRKVLIVTPNHKALFHKWSREVGEFVRRCVKPEHRALAESFFPSDAGKIEVERLDDLVRVLRRRGGRGSRVVVAHTGVFGDGKLLHEDLKRRFLLGLLFRHWGNRFRRDDRERLLRGAPPGWPSRPDDLLQLTPKEEDLLPFTADEVRKAIEGLDRPADGAPSRIERLRQQCLEIGRPYARDRAGLFACVGRELIQIYRKLAENLLGRALPLVVIDEAHNWKNQRQGTNGYRGFRETIARRTRRALLLTATPFQLRSDELLELVAIGEDLAPAAGSMDADERVERLRQHREQVLRAVLRSAERASVAFAGAWARLPGTVTEAAVARSWSTDRIKDARQALARLASARGAASAPEFQRIVETAVADADPDVRGFLRAALELYVHNRDLSAELGRVVVRHRRGTEHRLFKVGEEFLREASEVARRSDRNVLHAAPGIDVEGEGELPHYLLMRCVSESKNGRGRTSLGSALTGCYSTLRDSAEGKAIQTTLAAGRGRTYLEILLSLVRDENDPAHPKVREVVERTVAAWRAGEKTLIFCFRTNTAERLRTILRDRIGGEIERRRDRFFRDRDAFADFRKRLLAREGGLIGIVLDRVLWSLLGSGLGGSPCPYDAGDLSLRREDFTELAALELRFDATVDDGVFLHRAVETAVARRLCRDRRPEKVWAEVLEAVADEAWVRDCYGIDEESPEGDEDFETADAGERVNLRGVHSRYEASAVPGQAQVTERADQLWRRRELGGRGERSVFDAYAAGPNLWLGRDPRSSGTGTPRPLAHLHEHLRSLTFGQGRVDWALRREVFQALRRAVYRESVLVRLLPEDLEAKRGRWSEVLVGAFLSPLPGQNESLADRFAAFLEDLRASSGASRKVMLEATRLKDQQFVALVDGKTKDDTRERVFAGFNTPLLPEVLVCTSVGSEGIDLHRQCRHVIHYDLAWNPAVLEQRTGRIDRIGSKTFRERALAPDGAGPFLEVGVPFLAGTYDERMYDSGSGPRSSRSSPAATWPAPTRPLETRMTKARRVKAGLPSCRSRPAWSTTSG
jgi:hypothetical protein